MIELDRLTRRFGPVTVVDGISFSVPKGEVLGFLGPNGAGKTTTMRMLAGALAPTSGSARVCGFDVAVNPVAVKTRIGYLPEGAPAWPDMTVETLLSFTARLRGFTAGEVPAAVAAAAAKADLAAVLAQPVALLSKGYRRRAGLAQALLHDPQVLILDEPTDGLDPNQKHDVRRMIRAMASEKAMIISTHILEEVEALCSRVVVIDHGRIVADGTPADLLARDPDHNGLFLCVAPDETARAKACIASVGGVAEVVEDASGSLIVRAVSGRAIAAGVAAALAADGIVPARFEPRQGRLDAVFRALTRPDETIVTAAPPGSA